MEILVSAGAKQTAKTTATVGFLSNFWCYRTCAYCNLQNDNCCDKVNSFNCFACTGIACSVFTIACCCVMFADPFPVGSTPMDLAVQDKQQDIIAALKGTTK